MIDRAEEAFRVMVDRNWSVWHGPRGWEVIDATTKETVWATRQDFFADDPATAIIQADTWFKESDFWRRQRAEK